MSMISAQIDELRELAGDGSMEWVAGPIRASVLRDAADTIWQLRDDLQRANAAVQDAEHDESMAWDRVRKAEAENAKLRECLQDLAEHIREDDGFGLDYGWMLDRMRELGVEL